MTHYYKVPDIDSEVFEFESEWGDHYFLAADAAEDFHTHHDGWECSWPLTFAITEADGTEIARYLVERESEPVFYAYNTTPAEAK